MMAAESYSESAITAEGFKARLSFTKSSWGIITLVPLTFAARVVSAIGSSELQSFMIWFLYPQKNSTLVLPDVKVGKTPIRQSLSFLGGLSLRNLCLTLVFKLFSFTLASIGQESTDRYFPFMIPSRSSFLTSEILISWRTLLSVSLRKQENLSTGTGLSPGSNPSIDARAGRSKSSVDKSLKLAILFRFLKISALAIADFLIGFLPTQELLSRLDRSRTEKKSSYFLNGLSNISSRLNNGCCCIALSPFNFVKVLKFVVSKKQF